MVREKKSGSEKRIRGKLIGFRASPEELKEIDAAADRAGLTRSAYVRAQSLATPKMKATRRPVVAVEQLARILAHLGKCGSNLNQIAHQLNAGENVLHALIVSSVTELREIAATITVTLGRRGRADSD